MKTIILIFLLYFSDILAFCGSKLLLSFMHYATIAISLISFVLFISKYRWSHVTFFIFLFSIVYPIYGSIKGNIVFDQPVFMGLASLRYLYFILFGYFLLLINYDYRYLLKQINVINLFVAGISIIAILILGIEPSLINSFKVSNNVLGSAVNGSAGASMIGGGELRGIRFSGGSSLMFISLIYYLIASLKGGVKKNWLPLIVLMIYILFVHKGRQPAAIMASIYIIYYLKMRGLSPKRVIMTISPIIVLFIILSVDSNILLRFTTILDGEKSEDFSTLARIWELQQIFPYILDNILLGFGKLSAQFRHGGFQTFFGSKFYLSDLGIMATIATGGIMLVLIYIGLYVSIWKKSNCINDNNVKLYIRYMLITYALLLVCFFNDILCDDKTIQFALVFYPLFRQRNINKYFTMPLAVKSRKEIFV